MNPENKIARFMRNSGPARILIPVGLILIVFGIILMCFRSDKYVETTGRIASVTEGFYDDEENRQQYDLEITYEADGKEYTGALSDMDGNYKVGDEIKVFYDPDDPAKISNSKTPAIIGPLLVALGVLAGAFGVFKTVQAFKKSRALDAAVPGGFPAKEFEGFKNKNGVMECYVRFDGHGLKPGYIVEDGDRKVLFEGKMLKNAMVGARTFEFSNHIDGSVTEHQVGHTMTQSFDNEVFSAKSWFKFDGENIWDVLHDRGLRINTNIRSKFPYLIYDVAKNGAPFARIETSSMYVHEEDEAEHKLVIPTGNMYYRVWTDSDDYDTLFLTVFAISETEQTIVE